MTFILDAVSLVQVTNFLLEENGVKKNANNSNFEYVVAGFRLLPHVGIGFVIIPLPMLAIIISPSEWVNADKEAYYTNTYSGDGGLHQAYIGAGWEPVKGLAVGRNFSYLWGSIGQVATDSYSNSVSGPHPLLFYAGKLTIKLISVNAIIPISSQRKIGKLTMGVTFSLRTWSGSFC